ncbi:IniB N-terminal domain-containing protein [Pseudonocardia kujensis]|uniref:IniB N-terminal domain-containing protein n=1 Tax=Pseudonocardia kujensis TaxID=1128675 RepID=UPI001E611FCB|nr:IniB N-terminal domain-containing protein [Pseudonocardia kujensis]MCE0766812.1 IniB N-terminal domain-containing protein [Pseudonocardia kujensis]
MATTTLLDLLMNLLKDPAEQQAFLANPTGYLQECGLADLSPEDIKDAVTLAADSPHHDWDGHGHHDLPPAPPVHHHHDSGDHDPHTEAANYLKTYITNTFVDDRRTFIDQSFHQDIDTHGGDVDQRIDLHQTTATGDGAVAVGGDNRAPVATGDHAVAGWGNEVVNGDDNAASFGTGSAVNQSGASADHGGALSGTGPANGTFTDSNDHLSNFGSGSLADKGGDASQTNSHNDTSTDSHDDNHTDSHNDGHVDSGHNDTDTTVSDDHSYQDDHTVTDDHTVHNNPVDDHSVDHSFDLHT